MYIKLLNPEREWIDLYNISIAENHFSDKHLCLFFIIGLEKLIIIR